MRPNEGIDHRQRQEPRDQGQKEDVRVHSSVLMGNQYSAATQNRTEKSNTSAIRPTRAKESRSHSCGQPVTYRVPAAA